MIQHRTSLDLGAPNDTHRDKKISAAGGGGTLAALGRLGERPGVRGNSKSLIEKQRLGARGGTPSRRLVGAGDAIFRRRGAPGRRQANTSIAGCMPSAVLADSAKKCSKKPAFISKSRLDSKQLRRRRVSFLETRVSTLRDSPTHWENRYAPASRTTRPRRAIASSIVASLGPNEKRAWCKKRDARLPRRWPGSTSKK